ncbi:sulfite exporter TauE/SafE family protein [Oculatella sp. LEGE 06141]|uniref:sulfite exporter TauE/SafE family protein n=1 Tax=Oculatella sp. LEGE 06141 TaxID=1828648 RepID=UPI00187F659E|nr:sulfite exporter TauE/SafE family protein [Oculatella sp. LEGE 06141]MBE9181100.1 sulfite exporter TauE/SafE family protein [Oculatella sp. LEGE 06141]
MPLILLGLVSFVAWFISMIAGGGSPLILIPLVSFLFGSDAIAPVITTGMLVGNAQRTLYFWQEIDWDITRWYLPGAIAGAILGAYTLTQIHVDWLPTLVGIALLLMVANYGLGKVLSQPKAPLPIKPWYFLPLAFCNAFGSGLIGSMGPILNPVYLSYGLVKERMIATKSVHVVVIHIVKLMTYAVLGTLTVPDLTCGLIIGLAAIPANWLGKRVLDKMSGDQFQQTVFAFVAVSGILMLWQQSSLLP